MQIIVYMMQTKKSKSYNDIETYQMFASLSYKIVNKDCKSDLK